MPTIRPSYPNNPASIPLLVPLGKDFSAVADAIPELRSHLRERFPAIRDVSLRLRNPAPPPDIASYTPHLHDASLVLIFTGKAVATSVLAAVTKEAVDFLKRRAKKIKAVKVKKPGPVLRKMPPSYARTVPSSSKRYKGCMVMVVECPRCKTKQRIHVARNGGQKCVETFLCIRGDVRIKVEVPDKIIRGPFPA
jgi:hypothetical protein